MIRVLRLSWPAMVLSVVVLLPFLGKAFTIDDTLFLLQAQHLLRDPLHPTAFEAVWTDVPQRLSAIMPSGPVMAYLLVPSVMLGGAEWAAHLVQIGLLLVGILATVSLGLRLGLDTRGARRAGLILAATPAVLAMAATGMPDVAALALGAVFMDRFWAWHQERRAGQLIGAALALALAVLARSHLVLLCGVAGLLACHEGRWWSWRRYWPLPWGTLLPLGAGLALAGVLLQVTRDPLRDSPGIIGAAHDLARLRFFPSNLLAFCSHWALSLPLCIPWAILRWRHLHLRSLCFIAPIAAVIIVLTTSPYTVWVAPIAGISALALYDIVHDALQRRDHVQFVLGAWILLALPVAIYIHMPPKYLIASAPAMALLLAQRISARSLVMGIISVGTLLGVLIIRADARFGEMGRRAAADLIAPRVRRGERVWFAGHWGFQWYAQQAGGRSLTRTPPHPLPGELVVASTRAEAQVMDLFPRRHLIYSVADSTPGGRILSKADGAGFFSNGWGYLPWTFGTSEIERFNVWQME